MKHSKLLIAAALSAAAWCSASQAQTVIYDVEYPATSTGTTPSESNWTAYPGTSSYSVYSGSAVREYQDYSGRWRQKEEPVAVIGVQRNYVYPETTIVYPGTNSGYSGSTIVSPGYDVIYTTPFDATITPRY